MFLLIDVTCCDWQKSASRATRPIRQQ